MKSTTLQASKELILARHSLYCWEQLVHEQCSADCSIIAWEHCNQSASAWNAFSSCSYQSGLSFVVILRCKILPWKVEWSIVIENYKLYAVQRVHGSKRGRCQFLNAQGTSMQGLFVEPDLNKHSFCHAAWSQQLSSRSAGIQLYVSCLLRLISKDYDHECCCWYVIKYSILKLQPRPNILFIMLSFLLHMGSSALHRSSNVPLIDLPSH